MDTESLFVHDVMFTIPLGKLRIPVTNTIVMMWIIMVVMIVLALILVRPKKFEKVPKGKQLVAETIVGGIQNILVKNMGKKGKDFTPYFGTILLFLVFANIASIFNIIPSAELVHHWTGWMPKVWFQIEPPTSDLNLPLVLALMTICLIPMSSITDLVKYQLSTNTDDGMGRLPYKEELDAAFARMYYEKAYKNPSEAADHMALVHPEMHAYLHVFSDGQGAQMQVRENE